MSVGQRRLKLCIFKEYRRKKITLCMRNILSQTILNARIECLVPFGSETECETRVLLAHLILHSIDGKVYIMLIVFLLFLTIKLWKGSIIGTQHFSAWIR